MKPSEYARGKWPLIIGRLFGEEFSDPKKHSAGPCGACKDGYRFSDLGGNGNYFCKCSDGEKDGFSLIQCAAKTDFVGAKKMVEDVIGKIPEDGTWTKPEKPPIVELIERTAKAVTRSKYLESRGCEVAPGLLFCESLPYFGGDQPGTRYAAMVSAINKNGTTTGWHVTYLQKGAKAPVEKPRLLTPVSAGANSSGACALYQPAEEMGIAEGIETAISAKLIFCVPVWAALNTAMLKAWEPPLVVKRVLIFGDNDANYAGHAAAYALAHRLVGKGLEVEVKFPPVVGQDWNDVILANPGLRS